MEAQNDLLRRFDVDPARLAGASEMVAPAAPDVAVALPAFVASAADPALALANWEHLIAETADPGAVARLSPAERAALFVLFGGSQTLSAHLRAAGERWVETFREALQAAHRMADDHHAALRAATALPWEAFSEQLRRHCHRAYLRIGLADLLGRYSVETTMGELTELATGLFQAAYDWARRIVSEQYGHLSGGADGEGQEQGFVVLAMGKLGGGELNYSSDVDVMYIYESDAVESVGGSRGVIGAREYCTRLAELVTRAMQDVTSAGFAFRVDLRLRPDGVNGPIANTVGNAVLYYGSYGQTWERSALIQARPIAGTTALGEAFLREIRPFVYRRYLDYATVADMKEMKARVEAQLGGTASRGNVKLGRGGIREIEFVVQVLQLIHGGRDERVRRRGSLPTLRCLVAGGYLPEDEGAALVAAYRHLRNVEHKIQIVQQRQTHTVPAGAREQEALARRLGYTGAAAVAHFWRDLENHCAVVRRAFEKLFYEPAAERQRAVDPEVLGLLNAKESKEVAVEALRGFGFRNPEARYEDLVLLRDGPPGARARASRRRVLVEVAPALLAAIRQAADPDLALRNLATFISSVGARTSFLALLRENPGTLRMLVELFGGSQFLANAFIRHPELLDTLVRADLVQVHRTTDDLSAELGTALGAAADEEERFDVLRRFRNQEFLRIGINNLQGLLGPDEVSAELTALAEVCLRAAGKVSDRDVCARCGLERLPGAVAVLAMGKLGGAEINYHSDLDLIFVYDGDEADEERLSAHECFSRFAQRLIALLQTTTREGLVYRIDTRLRPSGRSGPLVSSLDGFRRYHETSAQIWERQALIKARPVAGDGALGQRVAAIIAAFVYRAPLNAAEVAEMRRLRGRMERELAQETDERFNIKTGRGGLVDVEFVTQMLQLHFGTRHARVRVRGTLRALDALAAAGVLPSEDHALLSDGYRFLRRIDNALRLAYDRPVEELDRARSDLGTIARQVGMEGQGAEAATGLWEEYRLRREAVRGCYDRWFDAVEEGLR